MVPTSVIHQSAQKEAAKLTIIKRLKEVRATDPQMPGSLEIETDEAQEALAALLGSGQVRQARAGLYYLDESKAQSATSGNGFVALLAILLVISFAASAIALAVSAN
jgi:hypothetical protein